MQTLEALAGCPVCSRIQNVCQTLRLVWSYAPPDQAAALFQHLDSLSVDREDLQLQLKSCTTIIRGAAITMKNII